MRIIGGEFRKRRLQGPPDATVTRPISDMVKESVFNLLRGHPEDGAVLDCFAGTGSIGLEAISRGSPRCVFVERDRKIADILRANIEVCGAGDRAEVVVGDALGPGALSRCPRPVHLVFFDPPYPMVRNAASWARVKEQFGRAIALLDDEGYAVLRTPWPFLHSEDPAEADPATPARRHRGGRDQARVEVGEDGLDRGERRSRREKKRSGVPGAAADGLGEASDLDEMADDMEEIEIDWTTPEGQALMKDLMEGGAVEIGEDGQVLEPAAEGVAAPGAPAQGPRRTYTGGDLSVPGAVGPETHAYGGMAVHLYMKQRQTAG